MIIYLPNWVIPLIITIICYGYALFIHKDSSGYFRGIGNMFLLIPAAIISMIGWIIYAIIITLKG